MNIYQDHVYSEEYSFISLSYLLSSTQCPSLPYS